MTRFDVLVLFGSTSDASVYEPLCALLREQGWRVDFEVISAHRNPDRLEERLGEADFDSSSSMQRALNINCSTHEFNNVFTNCQTETSATKAP